MIQNLQESFARTMLRQASLGAPFNKGMSTQTFEMTTALKNVQLGALDMLCCETSARQGPKQIVLGRDDQRRNMNLL